MAKWSDWHIEWDNQIATRVTGLPGHSAWLVAISFAQNAETGEVALSELRVFPRHGSNSLPAHCTQCLQLEPDRRPPAAHSLTTEAIRALRLGELRRAAASELEEKAHILLPEPRPFQSPRKQRRGARHERYLAYVAALYEQECGVNPVRPYERLSKRLNQGRRSLYDNIRAARELRLLQDPQTQGRAGGRLTAKGRRLYREYVETGDI
jgi:hypothetical protein